MSDIQRWTLPHDGYAFQSDDGGYVTYADHVAAVAAAVEEFRAGMSEGTWFLAGVEAAREAVVTAIGYKVSDEGYWSTTMQADPIAAIDVLTRGKGSA